MILSIKAIKYIYLKIVRGLNVTNRNEKYDNVAKLYYTTDMMQNKRLK